jgi:hypothetical protein
MRRGSNDGGLLRAVCVWRLEYWVPPFIHGQLDIPTLGGWPCPHRPPLKNKQNLLWGSQHTILM